MECNNPNGHGRHNLKVKSYRMSSYSFTVRSSISRTRIVRSVEIKYFLLVDKCTWTHR